MAVEQGTNSQHFGVLSLTICTGNPTMDRTEQLERTIKRLEFFLKKFIWAANSCPKVDLSEEEKAELSHLLLQNRRTL